MAEEIESSQSEKRKEDPRRDGTKTPSAGLRPRTPLGGEIESSQSEKREVKIESSQSEKREEDPRCDGTKMPSAGLSRRIPSWGIEGMVGGGS